MHINNKSTYEVNTSLAITELFITWIIGFAIFSSFRPYAVMKGDVNMADISYAYINYEYDLPKIESSKHVCTVETLVDTRTPEEKIKDEIYSAVNKMKTLYPDIESSLILAVIQKESRYDPNVNGSGAIGLMQIIPFCHTNRMARLGVTDLYDIYSNVLVGTDTLSELIHKYNDVGLALMCYNMGEGKALYKYSNGGYSGYVHSVLAIKEEIERSDSHGTNSRQENAGSDSGNS